VPFKPFPLRPCQCVECIILCPSVFLSLPIKVSPPSKAAAIPPRSGCLPPSHTPSNQLKLCWVSAQNARAGDASLSARGAIKAGQSMPLRCLYPPDFTGPTPHYRHHKRARKSSAARLCSDHRSASISSCAQRLGADNRPPCNAALRQASNSTSPTAEPFPSKRSTKKPPVDAFLQRNPPARPMQP